MGHTDPVESVERVEIVERVCAIDVGKAEVTVCVRVPDEARPGRRRQEVRVCSTMTAGLLELADHLRAERVELVGMEATSSYWKPVFYLLEAEGFTCWLLNARDVKHVPGRAKTDKLDAVWLAKLLERGMCRASLVHPKPVRQLRDLTRYRRVLVRERTREQQRVEKLLEDAQIKLSSVVSDLHGVSGRLMMEAMIAGEYRPAVLAELAKGSLRGKIPALREALTGHFEQHHAFVCRIMLDRIDQITAQIELLAGRIDQVIAPFDQTVARLDEIPGIGITAARELIAEIGVDMSFFPTAAHLVSWAKFAPIDRQSAARHKPASTGKGNPWLAATLGEIAVIAGRSDTFLGERYRRISRRRGKKRALVALGNSILTIIWHLLSDPDQHYVDLGTDFYASRLNKQRRQRDLIRQLEHLTNKKVTLTEQPEHPAA
jgi:transposase